MEGLNAQRALKAQLVAQLDEAQRRHSEVVAAREADRAEHAAQLAEERERSAAAVKAAVEAATRAAAPANDDA